MKRIIGLLMVGLMVGVVGCGDDVNRSMSFDDNPVKSDADRLVGTWTIEDSDEFSLTFRSDGTSVEVDNGDEQLGIWALVGDQLTASDPDGSDSATITINFITDTEMTMTFSLDEDGEETVTYTRKT